MKKIYLFPGLGADERVFANFRLPGYELVFIRWITPVKNETIEAYALRLTKQIPDKNPLMIGVSFGGMIAAEIARLLSADKIILISSAKTGAEIAWYYRLAGKLWLDKLVPASLLKRSNFLTNWFFGASTTEEKYLLNTILRDTDPFFLKWALRNIAILQNHTIPGNLFHIHGTKDRLLPFRENRDLLPINDGGHLMILNKAEEITSLIQQILASDSLTASR